MAPYMRRTYYKYPTSKGEKTKQSLHVRKTHLWYVETVHPFILMGKNGSDGWSAASLALVSPCLKSISDWFSWWLRICGSSNVPAEGKHATTWSRRNYKMTMFSNQVSSIFLSGSLVTLVVVTVMPLSRL